MKEKVYFKNRHGKKIAVILERAENAKGLAFIMHGLGSFKEQTQIQTFAKAFLESGYNAIRFDATHTFGESEGNYDRARENFAISLAMNRQLRQKECANGCTGRLKEICFTEELFKEYVEYGKDMVVAFLKDFANIMKKKP